MRRALPTSLTALLLMLVPATSTASGPRARSAGGFLLHEDASLHLTGKHGFTLNEQGVASGTAQGPIYVHLKIVSSGRVTAELSIYPHGGSITGYGSAAYRRRRSDAVFSGTLSIARGSGSYSRTRGSGLSFSGTIKRSDDAIAVHVSGRVSD